MERCPRCRTKYDPSYTVSCSTCGALLVSLEQPVEVPGGFAPADSDQAATPEWGAPSRAHRPTPLARLAPFARWIIAALVILFGVVAAFFTDARRDDSGSIVDQGAVAVTEALVGDCVNIREEDVSADVIFEFVGIPCAEPHQMEVFAVTGYDVTVPFPDEFPGQEALEAYASDQCRALFEDYVGAPYDTEPLLDINYFTPEEEGWSRGDRAITCALVAVDQTLLVGSMEGLGMVHYQSLVPGCYDLPDGDGGAVYGMHPRNCEGAHDVEVFSSPVEPSGPDAPFDEAALIEFGDGACQADFARYLGSSGSGSELTWSYYYPSEESWADGDRAYICLLQRTDAEPLVGIHEGGSA